MCSSLHVLRIILDKPFAHPVLWQSPLRCERTSDQACPLPNLMEKLLSLKVWVLSNCTSPPVPKIWHGDISPLLSRLHREYPRWSFHIYLVLMSAVLAKATAPKKQRNHLSPGDCAIWGHQGEDLLQNDLSSLCHPADFFDKPKIPAGNSRDNCCALLLHRLPRDSNCSWQKKSSAPLLYFLVSNRGWEQKKK